MMPDRCERYGARVARSASTYSPPAIQSVPEMVCIGAVERQ
jgi:hypothetical protein